MPFQSVPNCAVAEIVFSVNNVTVQNSPTFTHVGGAYDQSDVDLLSAAVDGWVSTEYLPLLSSTLSYVETHVRGLEDENDVESIDSTGAGVGGVATPPLPSNVAFCVRFTTGLTGRSARGRAFTPGVPNTILDADENFIGATFANNVVAAWEALPALLVSAGWSHVVVSRFTDNAPRTTGIFFPINGYSFSTRRVASQRQRLG